MIRIKVKNSGIVKLKTIRDKDNDGDIFVAEATRHVPFKIRRVFFINHYKRNGAIRGKHAHKKLNQAIFCINGSFVLGLDDGDTKQNILMNNPSVGILLGPKLWHTMTEFSRDCNVLVLADDFYHERDYLRNYEKFLEYVSRVQK